MKIRTLHFVGLAIVLMVLASCAPAATPVAPQKPAATLMPATAPASSISRPISQDAAWEKIVEAAKKEGRVVVYGAAPFANTGRELSAAFKAQYGITVDMLILAGAQHLEKLRVEKAINQHVGDITQTGITTSTQIVKDDLVENVSDVLPELRDRSAFYVDPVYGPDKKILGFGITTLGILINTNLVKPDEIKSWKDLLDPKWKGKILMADPRQTGTGLNMFSTLTYHKVLDYDYFRQLVKQDLRLWGGATREMELMVGRGEYPVIFGIGSSVEPFILEGAPLKIIDPIEGSSAQPEPLMVVKDAPHPNAARVFANWILSKEGQTAYNKPIGRMPLRKDLPDYTPEKLKRTYSKLWNRTWEAAEQSDKDLKSGIVEQIFGKK